MAGTGESSCFGVSISTFRDRCKGSELFYFEMQFSRQAQQLLPGWLAALYHHRQQGTLSGDAASMAARLKVWLDTGLSSEIKPSASALSKRLLTKHWTRRTDDPTLAAHEAETMACLSKMSTTVRK